MKTEEQNLARILQRIDGQGYKAYKDIQGEYRFKDYTLYIDHVQGDPFAAPSRLRVRVPGRKAAFPGDLYHNRSRRVALQDYLTRTFSREIVRVTRRNRGSGKSGLMAIDNCGQEILERTAMVVNSDYTEARFSMGLPARGRSVLGKEAEEMFYQELPAIVTASLCYQSLSPGDVLNHVDTAEDQDFLRGTLAEREWVAFVANGSVLPRQSGVSDRPMVVADGARGKVSDRPKAAADPVPFISPPSLEEAVTLPHRGEIQGMAIPAGVTLIVGGGYHGKSTLLKALERGVYNHIPGDGREYVVSRADAVKIRAEDGRRVAGVDISPFINNLPRGIDTAAFTTEDASGSTSQAANIMEALEAGTSLLLLDEDTSATNFMIRDRRMQQLVAKDKEPIIPFIDKVRLLHEDQEVSTVLVVGGSGDYFDVSDQVIMMDDYQPRDVTAEARYISRLITTERSPEGGNSFGALNRRYPSSRGLEPLKGRKIKITARSRTVLQYGEQDVPLSYVEQLVDYSQTRAIGEIIYYMYRRGYLDGKHSLQEAVTAVLAEIGEKGLDIVSPFRGRHPGDLALPRKHELAAAINRMPALKTNVMISE